MPAPRPPLRRDVPASTNKEPTPRLRKPEQCRERSRFGVGHFLRRRVKPETDTPARTRRRSTNRNMRISAALTRGRRRSPPAQSVCDSSASKRSKSNRSAQRKAERPPPVDRDAETAGDRRRPARRRSKSNLESSKADSKRVGPCPGLRSKFRIPE